MKFQFTQSTSHHISCGKGQVGMYVKAAKEVPGKHFVERLVGSNKFPPSVIITLITGISNQFQLNSKYFLVN